MLRTLRELGLIIYRLDTDANLTRYDDDDALMAIDFSDLVVVRP